MSNRVDLVQVCVRTRPLTDAERQHKKVVYCDRTHCRVEAQGKSARSFAFTHCFEEDATQDAVFAQCGVTAQVERSLDGFASLIFAFGQTGAGKTYTMFSAFGDDGVQWDSQQAGLIPRSMVYLFNLIEERQAQSPVKYNVRASFIEIYNEQVSDLLRLGSPLKVHWKEDLGFFAENHVVVECSGADDAIAVVNEGVKNRKVGSHNLNSESSRSHSIFVVDVDSFKTEENGERYLQSGRLLFVDLAGSEKLKQTGSTGEVMQEAKNINKSLLTLGKVISTLSRMHKGSKKKDKTTLRERMGDRGRQYLQQHVPFRDSMLTKLLMQSFLGNSYVLMVCCCAPTLRSVDETLATLRYASRAMDIEVNPGSRVSLMGEKSREQQQQQIDMLKEEVKKLSVENRRLQQLATSQPSSSLSSSPSLSSSSGSPHFASSSSFSNSPNAAHRLTPPPYSFLPMLHSPSPSHAPVPLHLTLNRSQSPTRLSSTSSLSPIGSPTRHSPLLQMYQQNQQQQQFVCPQPLSSLSSLPSLTPFPPSLSSFPSLPSPPSLSPILPVLRLLPSSPHSLLQQMSEEPLGVDDLKRQLVRLEMLLSEVTVQNSHLKGENSQLFAVCEQTKSEYTRLLHKLDTMEEIFFRQGELPLPWSSSRILPEPPKSEAFLKKVKSLTAAAYKPIPDILQKPPLMNSLQKPSSTTSLQKLPLSSADTTQKPLQTPAVLAEPLEDSATPETAPEPTVTHQEATYKSPLSTDRARKSRSSRKSTASSKASSPEPQALPESARKPPVMPDSARKPPVSPDPIRKATASSHSARKPSGLTDEDLEPIDSRDSARKATASPNSARKSPPSPDISRKATASPNSLRRPPKIDDSPQEEDMMVPLNIENVDE